MNRTSKVQQLTRAEMLARLSLSGGIALTLLALRQINPESVSWLPIPTSCGAFTGLPCIFCGVTRAIHHLLNAEFARALYFNWIAFPIAVVAVTAALFCVAELAGQRRLFVAKLTFRVTPRTAAYTGGVLVALWIVQVSLAVYFQKHELLNPGGPLYAFFVK